MPPKEQFLMYSASKMMSRFLTEMIREKMVRERLNIKISVRILKNFLVFPNFVIFGKKKENLKLNFYFL